MCTMMTQPPPLDCLFFPDKYFSQLTRWVFTGITRNAPAHSTGARNLIQFTVEDTLSWIIKSTCMAVSEMTSRKAISAHSLNTIFRILSQRSEILQGDLPEYPGLDELSASVKTPRPSSSSRGGRGGRRGGGARGTSAGRRARSRSARRGERSSSESDD